MTYLARSRATGRVRADRRESDERQTLLQIVDAGPKLASRRAGQPVIADKNYFGRDFEATLASADLDLLRPARKGEAPRQGTEFFKPLRQVIELIDDTFRAQLDLERHGGHTRPEPGSASYNASSR